jgi:two-component system response regulator AlgR
MKIMICDDETLARDRLRRMLESMPDIEIVGEASNGKQLLEQLPRLQPDLIITDIRMPAMDGMEAAQHIAQMKDPPAIIFCTAHDEYALEAFQVQAIGYLVKPVRQEALAQALAKASRINRAQLEAVRQRVEQVPEPQTQWHGRQYISSRSHRGIELVPIDQIRYFKADQKYVTARYPEGELLIDETLKELEDEFGERFIRAHRNALVALQHIEGIEHATSQYQLRLRGIEERIPVSRRHATEVKSRLQRI